MRPEILFGEVFREVSVFQPEGYGYLGRWIGEKLNLERALNLVPVYETALYSDDRAVLEAVISLLCRVDSRVSTETRQRMESIYYGEVVPTSLWRSARDFLYPELREQGGMLERRKDSPVDDEDQLEQLGK